MQEIDYYDFIRDEMYIYIPQRAEKTLDVGCASGSFSEYLKKEKGSETWGIEMEQGAAKIAKTRMDHVLIGAFDEVKRELPGQYFDCIFFNDVLEHMIYPDQCLIDIKSNLKPEGKIIASIPNIRHIEELQELLLGLDWRYRDVGVLDRTHLRFFTRRSIIRMFENCGYNIDSIEGINPTKSRLISFLNKIPSKIFDDIDYKQFAIVASIR